MPRSARIISNTNIYHVMIRGINRQIIFEDDEDYKKFLYILLDCVKKTECRIYAYCLMPNHVHLLVDPRFSTIETVMKSIGIRYARFYNDKYQRTGHLFQDRFRSENVEDDRYFLVVLRYILQNPLKAGLENELGQYPWSSYKIYKNRNDYITDAKFAIDLAGDKEKLLEFLNEKNDDEAMEMKTHRKIRLNDAKDVLEAVSGCRNVADFQNMDSDEQAKTIEELYKRGLSMFQISLLSGKSKTTIYRKLKGETKEPSRRSVNKKVERKNRPFVPH